MISTIVSILVLTVGVRALHPSNTYTQTLNTNIGTPAEFQRVNALIQQGKYDSLVRCDQLRQQMQLGSVFYGFNEGEISFAPTYRMVAGESKEYGNKRNQNPSYCDRVLWRSRQGLSDVLNLNAYEACWDMNKGDHRPVVAEFEMSTRKLYRFQGLEAERRLETGAIHITNLELYIDNEIVQSNYPCRIRFEGDVLRENVGTEYVWVRWIRRVRVVRVVRACYSIIKQTPTPQQVQK